MKYKILGGEHIRKIKKTFQQWCEENGRLDLLRLWAEENKLSPNEVSYGSKKVFLFDCPRNLHSPRSISLDKIIRLKKGICIQCNSIAQYGIDKCGDDFLDKYWDWEKNKDLNPWVIPYSSTQKIYLYCQNNCKHGSILTTCNAFSITAPHLACSKCNIRGNAKPIKEDSLGYLHPDVLELWSSKNILSPFEVTEFSHKMIWWKCPDGKHEDYCRSVSETLRYKFRCPDCVNETRFSILQYKVTNYLKELGYNLKHEYECNIKAPSLTGYRNSVLPYDNEVLELKLIIEVMGEQHYRKTSWNTLQAKRNQTTPELEFLKLQQRDKYKKEYALNQGYYYLSIPYYLEDNDAYKQAIDNKINFIESVTTTLVQVTV